MATETQDRPVTQPEREATADFDATANGGGDGYPRGEVDDERPRTMEELEAAAAAEREAQVGEEEDGQYFIVENEKRVSLSTLYGRNVPVEHEFVLGAKGIKGGPGTGLISFTDPDMILIVPVRAGATVVVPTYNPDGSVKKVVLRQQMKPLTAYDARTEAGQVALRGE